ncbi:hypothetical protein [Streptomyces shenzhenensis]|uniref:hypothetical protein n=1 Tax=Streptomyces shenzhenensis TaxID=943815 RepID=UPI001F274CB0|nr:hypothetical protein [Streptomyces shenzhenensis]
MTTWFTSPEAVAAAKRMAAAKAVGDPVCSLAAVGQPNPNLVPHVPRIGIGHYDNYWCLIW